jgi:hypothetical protein
MSAAEAQHEAVGRACEVGDAAADPAPMEDDRADRPQAFFHRSSAFPCAEGARLAFRPRVHIWVKEGG